MSYMKDLRYICDIMLHPGKATARNISANQILALYYKFSIIPIVLLIAFSALVYSLGLNYNTLSIMPFASSLSSLGILPAIILSGIIVILVIIPLSEIVNAIFYQLVGKNFLNAWKGSYSKTFTALMFATFPMLAGYFLLAIPVLNIIYLAVAFVWVFVISIIALASQHKISRTNAFVSVFATTFIICVLVMLFIALATLLIAPAPIPPGYPYM